MNEQTNYNPENKWVTCPACEGKFTNNFDHWSIKASGRCVDCQKVWEAKPENDPNLTGFEIAYHYREDGSTRIYAKDEQEAREKFGEEYDDAEIDDIREVKKNK